jgi:hypothetical protein
MSRWNISVARLGRRAAMLAFGAATPILAFLPAASGGPSISVSPASAASGSSVTISGSGWSPFDNVAVTLFKTTTTSLCELTADSTGTIETQSCTLPTQLVTGSYSVRASDGGSTATSATNLAITPAITVLGFDGEATSSVADGQTASLTGSGFAATSKISATIDGTAVTLAPAATTTSAGSFTGTAFTVPSLSAGAHTLVVSDASSDKVTRTIDAFKASIAATANLSGHLTSLSGAGWPGNDSLEVRLLEGVNATYVCSVVTDSSGAVEPATCNVPANLVAGSYTLQAEDNSIAANGAAGFVIKPSVTGFGFDAEATANVGVGQVVTLSGSGFAATSTLTATLDKKAVALSPAVSTNSQGGFSGTSFTVTATKAGPDSLVVTDGSGNTATVQFQVWKATIAATAGAAGHPTVITGSGWPSNESPEVRLVQGTVVTYVCSVPTDESGTIEANVCTVPSNIPAGSYTLQAEDNSIAVQSGTKFSLTPSVTPTGFNGVVSADFAVGQVVSLTGSGFAASSALTATIDKKPITLSGTLSTTSAGSFSGTTFTVGTSLKAGAHTLVVSDSASHTATYSLVVFAATIAAAPAPAGRLTTVTGSGWASGTGIEVFLVQGSSTTFICSVVADATGTVEPTSCTVSTNLQAGNYTLRATAGSVEVNSATLFAITPWASVTSTAGTSEASATAGTTLHLSGNGFAGGGTITAELGTTALTLTPAPLIASTTGSFSGASFVVPNIAKKTYVLTVTDGHNVTTVQLTVD